MFYGFGIREDDLTDDSPLMEWAKLHGIDTKMASSPAMSVYHTLRQVTRTLSRECQCSVYLTVPHSLQYDFVIGIARNWTLDKDWKEESVMERAQIIQEVKWHYDAADPKAKLLKCQQAARYVCTHLHN
jgi:hypothetical protein